MGSIRRPRRAGVGDTLTAYFYGDPAPLRVAAVVPTRGLAGFGFGATVNRNLFVAEGTLVEAARRAGDGTAPGRRDPPRPRRPYRRLTVRVENPLPVDEQPPVE